MKGNTTMFYAITLIEHTAVNGKTTLSELVNKYGLKQPFLEQVGAKLSRAGILLCKKGPGNGYTLAKPANDITLSEVNIAITDVPVTAKAKYEGADSFNDKMETALKGIAVTELFFKE